MLSLARFCHRRLIAIFSRRRHQADIQLSWMPEMPVDLRLRNFSTRTRHRFRQHIAVSQPTFRAGDFACCGHIILACLYSRIAILALALSISFLTIDRHDTLLYFAYCHCIIIKMPFHELLYDYAYFLYARLNSLAWWFRIFARLSLRFVSMRFISS